MFRVLCRQGVIFDLVDYISFIGTENVAFFDLVDYISFIALGVYSVGVYSVGVYYLGQPILDLKEYSLGVYSLGVYSLGVDYISFIASENVVFFDLVDYISFIATEKTNPENSEKCSPDSSPDRCFKALR